MFGRDLFGWHDEMYVCYAHFLFTVRPVQHIDALETEVPRGAHVHDPLLSVFEQHCAELDAGPLVMQEPHCPEFRQT